MRDIKTETVRRIWDRDPSLWHDDSGHQAEISRRLGWLTVPREMRRTVGELVWFTREAKRDGFERAILLGMGGSSLSAEVFRRLFAGSPYGLRLRVMDSTDPTTILRAEKRANLERTLFIVSSKSGSTVEVDSLFRYFYGRTGGRGEQFVAITDPGTSLERLARDRGFRRVFINPPDIGGRYSALSLFGLVPAALAGVDTGMLLDSASLMADRCGPGTPADDNPGLKLGWMLGEAALEGRDKVTLIVDHRVAAFGLWVEQLLAESTGKEGKGLIPVTGEPLGPPEEYGSDRVFVTVGVGGAGRDLEAAKLTALERAGHPVIRLAIRDIYDWGAEFFQWEFATAVAGAVLGVNPFDQPNVQEAKDRTRAILAQSGGDGAACVPDLGEPLGRTRAIFRTLAPGRDYLNFLMFVPFDASLEGWLETFRAQLRGRHRVATSCGYGPRYLHSTGQLHKGGPDSGVFIFLTCEHDSDPVIPGARYSFAQLQRAQALGDIKSLVARGRRVAHFHLSAGDAGSVREGLRPILSIGA